MSAVAQKVERSTVNRAASAMPAPVSVRRVAPPAVAQRAGAMKVSSPSDPAEKEAEQTAARIMHMPEPAPALNIAPGGMANPRLPHLAGRIVQRETALSRLLRDRPIARSPHDGQVNVSANLAAEINQGKSSGAALPPSVRRFMEPRFGANFNNVRVHTGARAANLSQQLSARAFTVGNNVFFGNGQFQPDSRDGRELLAHELTHTIQQGAATQDKPVHRSLDARISQHSGEHVQRGFLPDPFEYIAGKANSIPGFTLFTVVIGFNPITHASVERSAGNLLRGAIELIPGGGYITDALNNHGIFDKISHWTQSKFNTIKDIGANIWTEIKRFIKGLGVTDLGNLGGVWNRGKQILTGPVNQMIGFAKNLKDGIVQLIKDAILKPIGAFARTTSGYPLLCSVMGRDPITGDPAQQDPEVLMGGFMTFVGEQETWATMRKAKAVPRAFLWFKNALGVLKGFVAAIPGLFVSAFKSLEIVDIVLIPRAFIKLSKVFVSFAGRFISWGANAVWDLLEIVFDVVKPGILGYVKRTGAALKGILRNPMPFVGNLVNAGKLGFQQFATRFGAHLKAGLLDWLTGSLPGVYIPASFALKEIVKFALSVLGLTWASIRAKLVKATSETVVKGLETSVDIVVTLVREGPAAAWEKIKEQLGNLKDMVIGGITDFVVDMVVKKAVPKIVAMFIPGAGFISAILSIYDTVMVFVQKLAKIAAVVGAFVNSIAQIAAGNIAAAAKRVEGVLAGLLSLAISFLAGFAGLGKVADKVMGVIQKIRAPIDKALDAVVNWIVTMAKKLVAKGAAAVGKLFSWAATKSRFKDEDGHSHTVFVAEAGTPKLMIASTPMAAESFLDAYLAKKSDVFRQDNAGKIAAVRAAAQISGKIVDDIAKKTAKPNDPALPGLQQSLLNANVALSGALADLINSDVSIAKIKEKYLLEGLTGTYGSMPKPKGDGFTADHQPQAAVLEATAEFDYFSETGELAKRAASRAKAGFAINLHHNRHTAGSTYGSKGKATKAGFLARIKPLVGNKKRAEQRALVIAAIKADLIRDVAAMKAAAAPGSANWEDIRKASGKKEDKENLVKEVSGRIMAGEGQMAAQDIDSLAG
ncbi:MAG: hypothetical protein B7Y41_04315 [Hydrogenophilales bacterium 28-61-23]|nr:MAG: hypothetical protein B7Y41_04315 [Hydrogenophilales bacterium 28-61-23]